MSPLLLDGLHDALPQEHDVRPSIALALEHLRAVDMALDGTVAPGQGAPRWDGRERFLSALGKAGQRLNPPRGRLAHPRFAFGAPAFPPECEQGLAQGIGLRDRGISLGQLVERYLRGLRPRRGGAHPGECAGSGRWPRRAGGGRGRRRWGLRGLGAVARRKDA